MYISRTSYRGGKGLNYMKVDKDFFEAEENETSDFVFIVIILVSLIF